MEGELGTCAEWTRRIYQEAGQPIPADGIPCVGTLHVVESYRTREMGDGRRILVDEHGQDITQAPNGLLSGRPVQEWNVQCTDCNRRFPNHPHQKEIDAAVERMKNAPPAPPRTAEPVQTVFQMPSTAEMEAAWLENRKLKPEMEKLKTDTEARQGELEARVAAMEGKIAELLAALEGGRKQAVRMKPYSPEHD
jgi:hypothetical protein